MTNTGRRIRAARILRGLSQREAAELVGLSEAAMIAVERCRVQVHPSELRRFCQIWDAHLAQQDAQVAV